MGPNQLKPFFILAVDPGTRLCFYIGHYANVIQQAMPILINLTFQSFKPRHLTTTKKDKTLNEAVRE